MLSLLAALLRRVLADVLLSHEGNHIFNGGEVRDGKGESSRGERRGDDVLICSNVDQVGNNVYIQGEFDQD